MQTRKVSHHVVGNKLQQLACRAESNKMVLTQASPRGNLHDKSTANHWVELRCWISLVYSDVRQWLKLAEQMVWVTIKDTSARQEVWVIV